ncbi:helix-turn-helix domain-containing protein [Spirochaeta dissipatitropha]
MNTVLADILEYMQEHLTEKLTVSELAEHVCLTESRVSHLFKEKTGHSPIDYFLRMKIQAASVLIARKTLSNRELAELFGFSDEFHFSKVFKKKTGMSPQQFRMKTYWGKQSKLISGINQAALLLYQAVADLP